MPVAEDLRIAGTTSTAARPLVEARRSLQVDHEHVGHRRRPSRPHGRSRPAASAPRARASPRSLEHATTGPLPPDRELLAHGLAAAPHLHVSTPAVRSSRSTSSHADAQPRRAAGVDDQRPPPPCPNWCATRPPVPSWLEYGCALTCDDQRRGVDVARALLDAQVELQVGPVRRSESTWILDWTVGQASAMMSTRQY